MQDEIIMCLSYWQRNSELESILHAVLDCGKPVDYVEGYIIKPPPSSGGVFLANDTAKSLAQIKKVQELI